MTAGRTPKALGSKVNECLKLGSEGRGVNVRFWVVGVFN